MRTPLSGTDLIVYYEALTGKLDALYTQLDQVFADAELPAAKTEFRDVQVVLSDDKQATMQFRDAKVMPFAFQSVSEAFWRRVSDEAGKGFEQGVSAVDS